ncbi:unnamed protein product [Prorocentrum cordatum]|uniref:Uncharacterized protein n=1 Tax=Prorocentrum cordatum TaxID=2364126 RepID=A0ABN9ULX5_9DINO|nr:unnamed protein product [Polarella glacialis]
MPSPPVLSVLVTLALLSMLFGLLCMPLPLVAPVFVMYLSCVPLPLGAPVLVMLAMPSLLSVPLSANGIGPFTAASTRGSTLCSTPACPRGATRPSRIPLRMMMLPRVANESTTTPPSVANNLLSQRILPIALPILMLPRSALDPDAMHMPMLPLVVCQGTMTLPLVPNGLFS